ncbi:MAG: hypothetical protein JO308_06010 [Verrucomicrobia bacterium]|nr:hypothetical protein [Verrucomicrobiota bacterium]
MRALDPQLQSRQKRVATLLTIAQIGYAHWSFGNLYEAMVRVPDRIAEGYEPGKEDRRLASIFSSGSPVRYYLPGIPVVIGATLAAVLTGWKSRNDRPWFAALGISVLSGLVSTGWLVRTVNLRLFVAGQPLTPAEQKRFLRLWYRVNAFRLLAAGIAWLIAARLTSCTCSPAGLEGHQGRR